VLCGQPARVLRHATDGKGADGSVRPRKTEAGWKIAVITIHDPGAV
jgi:hypothetical protein